MMPRLRLCLIAALPGLLALALLLPGAAWHRHGTGQPRQSHDRQTAEAAVMIQRLRLALIAALPGLLALLLPGDALAQALTFDLGA